MKEQISNAFSVMRGESKIKRIPTCILSWHKKVYQKARDGTKYKAAPKMQ